MRFRLPKIIKRLFLGVGLLLICFHLTPSCQQFRMSASEIDEYFRDEAVKPRLLNMQIEGRNIHYAFMDTPQKPLVVFVHGAPGSLSAFIDYLKNPSLQQQVGMISIDRPGYGDSDFGQEEASLSKQAFYISEIIKRHLHGQKVVLVGHSLGAPIVAKVALDFPDLVHGLILVAGSIDPIQEKNEWYRPLGRGLLGKMLLPNSLWVTNEEIYFLKDELEALKPFWQQIDVPVTVIHGTEDKLVPKENVEFAQKMIPPQYLNVWLEEGVNHFIPWNRPDLIIKAIELHTQGDN
ncbi:MAG: alpha/beta hydrolase [Cyclobacteriaceae bacterium]